MFDSLHLQAFGAYALRIARCSSADAARERPQEAETIHEDGGYNFAG
jgi:hypothetical protein